MNIWEILTLAVGWRWLCWSCKDDMCLTGAWTSSSSNGKHRRFLQGSKLTGGKVMQILGQENRTGLAPLGEAWSASSSMLRQAGRQHVRLPRNCRENQTRGRQALNSHLAKGKNWQHGESSHHWGGNRKERFIPETHYLYVSLISSLHKLVRRRGRSQLPDIDQGYLIPHDQQPSKLLTPQH